MILFNIIIYIFINIIKNNLIIIIKIIIIINRAMMINII